MRSVMQDPRPHLSVAWALGNRTEQLSSVIAALHGAGGGAGVACQGLQWSCQVRGQLPWKLPCNLTGCGARRQCPTQRLHRLVQATDRPLTNLRFAWAIDCATLLDLNASALSSSMNY